MIRVEYSPEFADPRNPLIPVINPDDYAKVLMSVGIPDKDIPTRTVIVSSRVFSRVHGDKKQTAWANFNPRNNLTTLYPGAGYPVFFGVLASSLACYDEETAFNVAQEATEEYHNKLRRSLVHEARHDGDNYKGIDFGKTAVQNAFTIGYWILGVAAGALIANTVFPEAQPLVYEAAGLGLGVPISLMAGYDKNLHYQVDPIEIRARRYEQRANQVEFKNLVETVVNPQVDLDYIHNICRNEGTDLAISNREILDLRFGG